MSVQEGFKKQLLLLSRRPDNALCADCRLPQPTWASFNLGLFMCMTCLGTHISRVRSITLDNWDAPSVALMGEVGNARANAVFEAKLPAHARIHPGVDDRTRSEFIKAKYVQRAFYGQPQGGAGVGAGAAPAVAEARPLSKMEQRQARLQAKAAQPSPVAPSGVSQPAPIRQSSVPTPSSAPAPAPTAAAAAPVTMFSGMNTASPVVANSVLSPTPSHVASQPAPVKQVPTRVHSASPWVSKAEHQQVQHQMQQQQQQQQSQLRQHQSQAAAPAQQQQHQQRDFLDLSSVSDTPAVHPAAGHAADDLDLFAGMSVSGGAASNNEQHAHPHVDTSGTGAGNAAGLASSDLLSYYAAEPFSAPARSQHPAATAASSSPSSSTASSDIFSFMQPSGGDVGSHSGSSTDLYGMQHVAAAPPAAQGGSSFSFLDGGADSAAGSVSTDGNQSDGSAFSFMSGGGSDAPAADGSDFTQLLAPAAAAAFPVPGMGGVPHLSGSPLSASPLLPLSSATLPISHSFSHMPSAALGGSPQPFLMHNLGAGPAPAAPGQHGHGALPHSFSQPQDLFGAGHTQPMAGYMNTHGMAQHQQPPQQQQPYGGLPFNGLPGVGGGLAPLPGSFGQPSLPQFNVQSVQATYRAQASLAQQVADDPFAHIESSPSDVASSQPLYSPSCAAAAAAPPKAPHECDVAGCSNKKVARGLCSKHIREGDGSSSGSHTAPAAASAGSSFDFLAQPQQQQAAQQQPTSTSAIDSSFSFLSQPAASTESSSFSFLV